MPRKKTQETPIGIPLDSPVQVGLILANTIEELGKIRLNDLPHQDLLSIQNMRNEMFYILKRMADAEKTG